MKDQDYLFATRTFNDEQIVLTVFMLSYYIILMDLSVRMDNL